MWKLLSACLCPVEDQFRVGFIRRRAHLQGVGRGVTEPDIKQKLGQARGARRGRQERACGIEPCVGTNLTWPPPPHLRSYLLTHALLSIPTPPCSSIFSSIVFSSPLPTLQALRPDGEKELRLHILLRSDRQDFCRDWRRFPFALGTPRGASCSSELAGQHIWREGR